jgi:hypothetical protein
MIIGSIGTRTAISEYKDYNPNQLYETPKVAVEALLRKFEDRHLPSVIWEPACGRGNIVKPLVKAGHEVLASDIMDFGSLDFPYVPKQNFFAIDEAPPGVECIVTNPPYKDAHDFVRHACKLCPIVIMLLRFAFYESERRCDILDNAGLIRVLCFRKRLPTMHRDGWEGKKTGSGIAFAWFIWNRRYRGITQLERISWER